MRQVKPIEVLLRAGIKAFASAMPLPAGTAVEVLTPHVDMFVQQLERIFPTVSKVSYLYFIRFLIYFDLTPHVDLSVPTS